MSFPLAVQLSSTAHNRNSSSRHRKFVGRNVSRFSHGTFSPLVRCESSLRQRIYRLAIK